MNVDAATLARCWLSVFAASGDNKTSPQLSRTIHIDQHTHGLRLVATDSYMLLTAWVPQIDHDLDPQPGFDEVPYASATAYDQHGRGCGMLAHLRRLAASDDHKGLEAVVRLNVPWQPDEHGDEAQLEGFEALAVVLEAPERERVQLEVYEGGYVNWQPLVARQKRSRTATLGLSSWIMGRLAKAAKVHGERDTVHCWFGGRDKPIQVCFGQHPEVTGLVMPVRWDFTKDAPFARPDKAEPVGGDPE